MAYFNNEDVGPECLLELRFLDLERRVEGARYIADNCLGPSDAAALGRAIKEHERRGDSNGRFSRAAGDCLAFKCFRDALEARSPEEVRRHVSTLPPPLSPPLLLLLLSCNVAAGRGGGGGEQTRYVWLNCCSATRGYATVLLVPRVMNLAPSALPPRGSRRSPHRKP